MDRLFQADRRIAGAAQFDKLDINERRLIEGSRLCIERSRKLLARTATIVGAHEAAPRGWRRYLSADTAL